MQIHFSLESNAGSTFQTPHKYRHHNITCLPTQFVYRRKYGAFVKKKEMKKEYSKYGVRITWWAIVGDYRTRSECRRSTIQLSRQRIGIFGKCDLRHESALLLHIVFDGHQTTIGQPHRILAGDLALGVTNFVLVEEQIFFGIFDLVLVLVLFVTTLLLCGGWKIVL